MPKKKYRMSTVVVIIGYIILIPSVLGILTCGGIGLMATGDTKHDGQAVAAGLSFVGAIGWLVSGLLGWLLIMKKRVLQCNHCGAVVATG
jgi:hypothetical protein